MIISYSHQFLFVHATKTAGSSVAQALQPYMRKPEEIWYNRFLDNLGIHINYFGPAESRRFRKHATAEKIKKNLPAPVFENFFKFGFVRNPWAQLVSHYHYIQQNTSHHRNRRVAKMSFEEFVKMWINKGKVDHSKMFYDDQGKMLVDFIGRFETLSRDFNAICQHLKLDLSLPYVNRSSHRDYREYYDDSLQHYVAKKLHKEIEYFGYTFDPADDYQPILSPEFKITGGLIE